jgi:hypothetical protein
MSKTCWIGWSAAEPRTIPMLTANDTMPIRGVGQHARETQFDPFENLLERMANAQTRRQNAFRRC